MLPTAITLRNYRSFAGEHRFELRPITLFYGDNNAGKSALLRTLPLIADSVSGAATGALRLESTAVYGGGFDDLQWRGAHDEDAGPDLALGLAWDEASAVREVEYTLIRRRHLLVRRCLIRDGSDESPLALEWLPDRGGREVAPLRYQGRRAGAEAVVEGEIDFRGLVPERGPDELAQPLDALRAQLTALRGQVQWLQAKRRSPDRRVTSPSGPAWHLAPDGHDAPQRLYSNPDVLAAVSRWYEDALGRQLALVEQPPDEFRVALRNARGAAPFDVDLLDSGQGCIQVLPVLVALALARDAERRGPRIIALEEPESHLHGRQQLRLTGAICETVAATGADTRIALETHSQHVLLGVQLALLEGRVRPDDVILYWVRQDDDGRSHLDTITLDEDAYLDGYWPDPFRSARDAARRVLAARRSKGSR